MNYENDKLDVLYWNYFKYKIAVPFAEAMDVDIEEVRDWLYELDYLVKAEAIPAPIAIGQVVKTFIYKDRGEIGGERTIS